MPPYVKQIVQQHVQHSCSYLIFKHAIVDVTYCEVDTISVYLGQGAGGLSDVLVTTCTFVVGNSILPSCRLSCL